MNILMIVILAIAALTGTGLIYFVRQRARQKADAYASFAADQGWNYHHDPAQAGLSDIHSFRDPSDDWTLKVIFRSAGASDGMTERRIEWHSPQGALPGGEAVLGMPLPAKAAAMFETGSPLGQKILKTALKATLHALGRTRFTLAIDEATASDPGGVVMSSPGYEAAMNGLRRNTDLARFRETHREADVPVIIRDETGLTLRRPGHVRDLPDLSEIVALGLSLRADL